MPINRRKKGNSYEVKLANEFTDLTGSKIYSNRYINKLKDNQKVDLNIEYNGFKLNIQAKNTAKSINYPKILQQMKEFNPEELNLIYSKVTFKGEFVIMDKSTFEQLFFKI